MLILLYVVVKIVNGLTQEGCDDGWIYYSQRCYQVNVDEYGINFYQAKGICETKDSHLASIWFPEEADFVKEKLLDGKQITGYAWIGLEPKSGKYGWNWVDGSNADLTDMELPPDHTNMCGVVKDNGLKYIVHCFDDLKTFICKKGLKMVYVVSDIFNDTYTSGPMLEDPERLLFERVWPPKLQLVDDYLMKLATTPVGRETDCAYMCFRANKCRAFSVICNLNSKCSQFTCDVFEPRSPLSN